MSDAAKIPTVGVYRGVGIHDFQPAERIANVVRPAIDRIYATSDLVALSDYVADSRNPPEARMFAAARCAAAWEMAASNRERRPKIDLELVMAHAVGLDSLKWIDTAGYTTLLDPFRTAVQRDPAEAERLRRLLRENYPQIRD